MRGEEEEDEEDEEEEEVVISGLVCHAVDEYIGLNQSNNYGNGKTRKSI